jgi:hypothetical protein
MVISDISKAFEASPPPLLIWLTEASPRWPCEPFAFNSLQLYIKSATPTFAHLVDGGWSSVTL